MIFVLLGLEQKVTIIYSFKKEIINYHKNKRNQETDFIFYVFKNELSSAIKATIIKSYQSSRINGISHN